MIGICRQCHAVDQCVCERALNSGLDWPGCSSSQISSSTRRNIPAGGIEFMRLSDAIRRSYPSSRNRLSLQRRRSIVSAAVALVPCVWSDLELFMAVKEIVSATIFTATNRAATVSHFISWFVSVQKQIL